MDLVDDGIQLVVPDRFGKVLAGAITLCVALGLMYIVNYPIFARWVQGVHP